MLYPFIHLLISVIDLYMFCVFVWAVLSSLISFKVVNSGQPVVRKLMYALDQLIEPVLKHIRKYLPELGGIDISPIILLLALGFLKDAIITYGMRL